MIPDNLTGHHGKVEPIGSPQATANQVQAEECLPESEPPFQAMRNRTMLRHHQMKKTIAFLLATSLGVMFVGCEPEEEELSTTAQAASPLQGLYGISLSSDTLIRIDPTTGKGTPIGTGLGFNVDTVGADFSCDGTFWAFSAIGNNQHILYTVDLVTGVGTIVQTFDTTGHGVGVGFEFGPDEVTPFWRTTNELNTLDIANATVTTVASYNDTSVSLTINPITCGDFLSVVGGNLVTVAPDGSTTVGPAVSMNFNSLSSAPDGTLYGHAGGKLYTIDPITGVSMVVGSIGSANVPISTPGTAFGPDVITCTPQCPSCSPHTQGFWKRQCKGPHPSGEHDQLPSYVETVNNTGPFTAVATVADLCDRLHPAPKNDKCEQAEAQFMATQLNLASGMLTINCCVDENSTAGVTVADIAALLDNPARTFQDCVQAQSLAASLNEGTALCSF